MRVIKARYELMNEGIFKGMLQRIEKAGRVCYKSEDRISSGSADRFAKMIIDRGHEAILEHGGLISVKFVIDRGISHEIVRHRISSFAQESSRYCNYSKSKFNKEVTFIEPCFWGKGSELEDLWYMAMSEAEKRYFNLLDLGATPEEARAVLPNSVKTELIMSADPREWRAFFRLRTSEAAHPQMREVARPLLEEFKRRVPILFDDIRKEKEDESMS